jgi:hypothetical protein
MPYIWQRTLYCAALGQISFNLNAGHDRLEE